MERGFGETIVWMREKFFPIFSKENKKKLSA
jgi:hypothetical protein